MDLWTEIKPILGPLIQAAVVLIVGTATVIFQLSQARTARNKLFVDLHDKRYKALTNYSDALISHVNRCFDSNPSNRNKPFFVTESEVAGNKTMFEEVRWLFGGHVTDQADVMYFTSGRIVTLTYQMHKEPSQQSFIDDRNEVRKLFFEAQYMMMRGARHYLYVGDIQRRAKQFDGDRWWRKYTHKRST